MQDGRSMEWGGGVSAKNFSVSSAGRPLLAFSRNDILRTMQKIKNKIRVSDGKENCKRKGEKDGFYEKLEQNC